MPTVLPKENEVEQFFKDNGIGRSLRKAQQRALRSP